jgi:hypothetical protein
MLSHYYWTVLTALLVLLGWLLLLTIVSCNKPPTNNNNNNNTTTTTKSTITWLSSFATNKEIQFARWGLVHGLKILDNTFSWPEPTNLGDRGIIALRDIQHGEKLIKVPFKLHLRQRNFPPEFERRANRVRKKLLQYRKNGRMDDLLTDDDDHEIPRALPLVLLMAEQRRDPEGFFKPYLDTVPEEFDTPNLWQSNELKWLQFKDLLGEIESSRNTRKAWFYLVQDALKDLDNTTATTTVTKPTVQLQDFLWAWSIIDSRAWEDTSTNEDIVVPFVDLFNHSPESRAIISLQDQSASFLCDTTKKGREIFYNYGMKSSAGLLVGYGFALPSNPADGFEIDDVLLHWYSKQTFPNSFLDAIVRDWSEVRHEFEQQYDSRPAYGKCHVMLNRILKSLSTTLQQDLQLLNDYSNNHDKKQHSSSFYHMKTALSFRISRKTLISRHAELCGKLSCLASQQFIWMNNLQSYLIRLKISRETVSILNPDSLAILASKHSEMFDDSYDDRVKGRGGRWVN